jgi:hypothetical protein
MNFAADADADADASLRSGFARPARDPGVGTR